MRMPIDGHRLKRWLFPSEKEKSEKRMKEELERRKRFLRAENKLSYEAASLTRHEALAKQRLDIIERRERIAKLQARTIKPAPVSKPVAAPSFSFEQNLFKDADDLAERLMGGKRRGR